MLTSLGIYTFSSLSARATVGQMTSTFLPGHARICIRGPLITPCFPHKRPPLATGHCSACWPRQASLWGK
jgi:hypothetical protein